MNPNSDNRVSFDDELLILVDQNDEPVGFRDKLSCHLGQGILHRAFSIFIFDKQNRLLLQQRSGQKLLWPLFWSNSCCSHPRKGEELDFATQRRLREELGFQVPLKFLYKFQYHASFGETGSENEICHVFLGRFDGSLKVNSNEIDAWKFVDPDTMTRELVENPALYTPWFKMEWEKIRADFWQELETI